MRPIHNYWYKVRKIERVFSWTCNKISQQDRGSVQSSLVSSAEVQILVPVSRDFAG